MQQAEQPSEATTQTELKARLGDAKINENNPFEEDLPKRKKYAEILTNVLSIYTHGAVIALNGRWGTGKTTFVKKWEQMLKIQKFKTIYFNAWQADYLDDPLVALIASLQGVRNIDSNDTSKFENLMKAGAKLAIASAVGFGKGVIKMAGGELVIEALSSAADECGDLFKKKVDEFSIQTKSMIDFKNELKKFVRWIDSKNPIVYFIDELDRCNPTYAVRVLERVKHLFEIPGVVFILSIDKDQLENSIKGYFGSDIDAEEYLRRFIDISYNLPQPELKDFCKYLYNYYNMQSFFQHKERKNKFENEEPLFLDSAEYICTFKQITLRQLDRIFALTAITLKEFGHDQFLFPDLFFFLTYLRVCFPSLFEAISDLRLSIGELSKEIEAIIPSQMASDDSHKGNYDARSFIYTIAKLLVTYNNEGRTNEVLFFKDPEERLAFETKKIDAKQLLQCIKHFDNRSIGGECPIKHLTNKINLLDSFMN